MERKYEIENAKEKIYDLGQIFRRDANNLVDTLVRLQDGEIDLLTATSGIFNSIEPMVHMFKELISHKDASEETPKDFKVDFICNCNYMMGIISKSDTEYHLLCTKCATPYTVKIEDVKKLNKRNVYISELEHKED